MFMKRRNNVQKELSSSALKKLKSNDDKESYIDILQDDSLYGQLIQEAGFVLYKGDKPNQLKCDQAIFQQRLKRAMKYHSVFPVSEVVDQFIKGLENHLEDILKVKWSLIYTQSAVEATAARGGQQDSLIRLLLNIDELQPRIITMLTEKLLEVAYDEDAPSDIDIPYLILANLRWLDHIVEPDILTKRIIELLEGCPTKVQHEVVSFVADIIEDSHHSKISEVLCKLYESTMELAPSILDAMLSLTLEAECLQDIHHKVLKTLPLSPPQHLPVIVRFLLQNAPKSSIFQVVCDVRSKLYLPMENIAVDTPRKQATAPQKKMSKDEELSDIEVLLFSGIRTTVLIQKYLIKEFLRAINDEDDVKSFRSLDFLLLLMFYEISPSRYKVIEGLMRNKIRKGIITEKILKITLTQHFLVLKEYFESFKKFSSILLRSNEAVIRYFGVAMYRNCFEYVEPQFRQDIILCLLYHIGDTEIAKDAAVSLLSLLSHEYTAEMSRFAVLIKGSLDHFDRLSLHDAKRLLDSIIVLVNADSSNAALHDELVILIRKQLSNSSVKFVRVGVINAVLMMKNIKYATDSSQETNSENERSVLFLKEIQSLFALVESSSKKFPLASALFMDELASTVLHEGMHPQLEKWISEKMIANFEEVFILDFTEDNQHQNDLVFPIEAKWSLEDAENKIILNLAPMAVTAEENRRKSDSGNVILTLCPLFRLLRMIESHLNNGSLEAIDALLGCPVYFPTQSVIDNFTSLSQFQQHAVLSCIFYTVNWFRELINAFVMQRDMDLKHKVLLRLRQVIQLQQVLSHLLPSCKSYIPTSAVFDYDPEVPASVSSTSGVKKGPKKSAKSKSQKRKKNEKDEITQVNSQVLTPSELTQKEDKAEEKFADLNNYKSFFRELHLDVFALLFRNISLDDELESQTHSQLSLLEAEFLLSDLNLKLSRILISEGKKLSVLGKCKEKGFSYLDFFNPDVIAQEMVRYLKPIRVYLEKISGFFQGLISDNDGVLDAHGMINVRRAPLIRVNTLLFSVLATFLSWSGLKAEKNAGILKSSLKVVSKTIAGDAIEDMELPELFLVAFNYISKFADSIVNIETAVALVKALDAMAKLEGNDKLNCKTADLIDLLLKREWYAVGGDREKGSAFNLNISYFLQTFLTMSSKPLNGVKNLCEGLNEVLNDKSKNPQSELYPTLDKYTLSVFYKCLHEHLVIGVKKQLMHQILCSQGSETKMITWNTALKCLHILIEVVKKYDSRVYLLALLKFSRLFIETFLRDGMPLMDACLKSSPEDVISILKNVQASTRPLQHVCTHSKVSRDASLMTYVPYMKKCLESLVFRVKAMLVVNHCSDAFWMGNLKNRDLHGEEILSQAVRDDAQEEGEEEEEENEELTDHESDVNLEDDHSDHGGNENSEKDTNCKGDNSSFSEGF